MYLGLVEVVVRISLGPSKTGELRAEVLDILVGRKTCEALNDLL